ncbi:MAG: hypothetical protein USCGTAYLOR_02690 [Chromatiales bacterium USCg_Taylor]|nr:MAG: hypothetical protein USCGTAYLOR_02690 [Chromatiales bacterium USCg_Taylor]
MSSRLTLSLALPLMMIVIGGGASYVGASEIDTPLGLFMAVLGVLCLGVTLVTTVATTLRSA